ncbi:O-antigen ligase RfaL [Kosakonia cowanii]
MTLTQIFSNNGGDWKGLWNRTLVFLFISTYFLDDITRYKHLIVILMASTAIYYIAKAPSYYLSALRSSIFYCLLLLSAAVAVSLLVSPDTHSTFREFKKSILESMLLYAILIPIILRDEEISNVARIIFYSFLTALSLRCVITFAQYVIDYKNGMMPFTDYRYRGVSDSLVYLFPALLNLWLLKRVKHRLAFLVMSTVFLFVLLGTLSRGAWLAILVMGMVWIGMARQWKVLIIGLVFAAITALVIYSHQDFTKKLITKLEQTDGSRRYKNGTQGTAVELVQANPWVGYGYGNEVYKETYNQQVPHHPEWIFKKSLGPHNLILFIWFGAGILGLTSLLFLYFTIGKNCIVNINLFPNNSAYNSYIMLLLTFIGYYLVRGNLEQIELNHLGIITGLLLALNKR